MKLIIAFSFTLFICITSLAQINQTGKHIDSDYFNDRTPGTPKTAGLGSFGNIPINHYRGLPEISLPLMTLTSRDLSLPISINYDASGVRTDELSGPVGIKWHLNAGGFVARDLNGMPDEHPSYGYWHYALSTDYYADLSDPKDWVDYSMKNTRDCGPDEFVINISGRTIRFVFDKLKQAVPIPRQNVKITYSVLNNKINQFTVITEDGIKYIFGGDETTIEERKVETQKLKFKLKYKLIADAIFSDPAEYYRYLLYGNRGGEYFSNHPDDIDGSVKTIDFFNTKWYLKKIVSPTSDAIDFQYIKSALNIVYVTKPSTFKAEHLLVTLSNYSYSKTIDNQDITWSHPYSNLWANPARTSDSEALVKAYLKFASEGESVNPLIIRNNYVISGDEADYFLDPLKYRANPGGTNSTQNLITESNIKLVSITTDANNNLSIESSTREDLPNSVKYDRFILVSNGQQVRKIRLNYSTISAKEGPTDFLWINEAYMLSRINELEGTGPYYGYHARMYPSTAIQDPESKKFAYEGLKEYNYKRLFLESVVEEGGNQNTTLYEFGYDNRESLRRRTTPLHTVYGFSRDLYQGETDFELQDGKKAKIINGRSPGSSMWYGNAIPTRGILNKITYPTKGRTEFEYFYGLNLSAGPRIRFIRDYEENGTAPVAQKEITYDYAEPNAQGQLFISMARINQAYVLGYTTDYKVKDTNYWIKVAISSSSPLNDITTSAPFETNRYVQVYNGTRLNHQGYEKFIFRDFDVDYDDVLSPITTISPNGTIGSFVFPFLRRHQRDHLRGVLLSHEVFTKDKKLIKSTVNTYTANPNGYEPPVVYGFAGGSYVRSSDEESNFWTGSETVPVYSYRYGRYKIQADWYVLEKSVETIYDESNVNIKFSTAKEFQYDPTNLQLVESKVYNEANPDQKLITKTKYVTNSDYFYSNLSHCEAQYSDCRENCPPGSGGIECLSACQQELDQCMSNPIDGVSPDAGAIVLLKDQHQVTSPVEVQTLVEENNGTQITSAVIYKYSKFGSIIRQNEIWRLKETIPTSGFQTSRTNGDGDFEKDSRMRKLHSYDNYSATGNLLQQTSLDGIVTQYQWGFNNSLVTSQTINPGTFNLTTMYDHKQGVGVLSTTDPNGRLSYYGYDNFNRLRLTKDHDGSILTRYRYHYKSDPDFNKLITGDDYGIIGVQEVFNSPDNQLEGETKYEWNFGDGSPLVNSSSSVLKTYSTAGTFTVTVKKTNPEFGTVTNAKTITIYPRISNLEIYASAVDVNFCEAYEPPTITANVPHGCPEATYLWEYNNNGSGWMTFDSSGNSATAPPAYTATQQQIRCTMNNACGEVITSNVVLINYYNGDGVNCGVIQR